MYSFTEIKNGLTAATTKIDLANVELWLNRAEESGFSKLHLAIMTGNTQLVESLLNNSAIDINASGLIIGDEINNFDLSGSDQDLEEGDLSDSGYAREFDNDVVKCSPLWLAVDQNNSAMFELLASRGATNTEGCIIIREGEQVTPINLPPLPIAASNDNIAIAEKLIGFGLDINETHEAINQYEDDTTYTALSTAASKGNQAIVEYLLANGAGVNGAIKIDCPYLEEGFEWVTPLTIAAKMNNTALVQYLLENGAEDMDDVVGHFTDSSLAIHYALVNQNIEMIQELIPHCNPQQLSLNSHTLGHYNVWKYAIQNNMQEVVEVFVANELMNVESQPQLVKAAIESNNVEMLKMLINHGVDLDYTPSAGQETALYYATTSQNLEMVLEVVKHNVNPLATGSRQITPLKLAQSMNTSSSIMTALLCTQYSYMADNNSDFVTQPKYVQPLFFFALQHGMKQQYDTLVENGAKINYTNGKHTTVDLATASGNAEMVLDLVTKLQVLVNSDAPVLPYIAQFASTATLELLVTHNPSLLQEQDETGCNALYSAIMMKNFDAALWLISNGVDVHALNEMGTPIIQFAQMNEAPQDIMTAIINKTNVDTLAKNVALHQASNPARYSTLNSEEEIAEGIIEFINSIESEYTVEDIAEGILLLVNEASDEYTTDTSSDDLDMDDVLTPTAAGGAYAAGNEALISTDLAGDAGILDTDLDM